MKKRKPYPAGSSPVVDEQRDVKLPYVIDNEVVRLADVLRDLLVQHEGRSLDVATAYFSLSGYRVLEAGLGRLGSFRLLLGAEPRSGEDVGMRPDGRQLTRLLRGDLEAEAFTPAALELVENLIRFLRRAEVAVRLYGDGFLHAKCYLFYDDAPTGSWDRLRPVAGIVGSSNFTGPGLTTNRELNLAHKTLLDENELDEEYDRSAPPDRALRVAETSDPYGRENRRRLKSAVGARAITELDRWYERQWAAARDFKQELIDLLDASKFGSQEYSPYDVYLKALFEYFRDDLEAEPAPAGRSAVDLAEFQEDAVKKARRILARYDGVMIADSVGLGKTWIGKKLLEEFAYHLRQKALVICPAALRPMWERELREATITAMVISQEDLGRWETPAPALADVDVVLIDESHNFRNRTAQRYENLERLIAQNGGRGRDGAPKKLILLTATPVNNDLLDLYHQISLFTRGDRAYFAAAGIGDLHRYFLSARRTAKQDGSAVALFNLLEEVVIRRTRPFIRRAYPEATIRGERISFPERRLRTVRYDLEATYAGIYEEIVSGIEDLRLAPYRLESFKKQGVKRDEFEEGREEALAGIFKSRYLKRFESSIEAFKISVRRALEFHKTFESYVLEGKVLRSTEFHRAMRYLGREDEEDDATPGSQADALDANAEARAVLDGMEQVDPSAYDLRKLHEAVQHDVEILTHLWDRVQDITAAGDAKLDRLRTLLETDLKGEKVLVFTYYKDTARYLFRELGGSFGSRMRRMDSGADPRERAAIVQRFAPKANGRAELAGGAEEIDVLISTDVLSEGQNLQDCGHLLNYDLHWNPTRMVQRAGRIDRIGTAFSTLWILNMFPDHGLERLLGLVQRLTERIAHIDSLGLLDSSVLGETVHPRNFNTLRRIRDEDGAVIDEEEEFTELASNEFLQQTLRTVLGSEGRERLEALPDGIHSGLIKPRARGMFFYFQAPDGADGKLHFWKYYDLSERRIIDNRYVIASLIQCERDTPRVVGEYDVFAIQEEVIQDILRGYEAQQAVEVTPRTVDPVQQTVATTIQEYLNHPDVERRRALGALRFLAQPMASVAVKALREAYRAFQKGGKVEGLLACVEGLAGEFERAPARAALARHMLRRDELRLVCFDDLCS